MAQQSAREAAKRDVRTAQSSKKTWRRPQWRARNVRTHC
ncbi:hypothetical protein LI90_3304 [Carbonactinospora thermoautotrophica]|uniref:Uncharacterized protein n=1 Tax=Carbonactinospora thermoautotrophica TaxID=1469144 RepID=A0A132MWM4_9ACTN|nr:hypothetical protein LI90_3304 [Carbonactinospora thermoautotrophica]